MVPVCILITLLLFSSLALTVGLQKPFVRQVPTKVNTFSRESNCSYGYIDHAGEIVIEPKYWSAGQFKNGRAWVVQSGHTYRDLIYINPQEKIVAKPVEVTGSSKVKWIDGEVGVQIAAGNIDENDILWNGIPWNTGAKLIDGLMPIKFKTSGNKKWGYVNTQGAIAIKPQFDSCSNFFDGLAIASVGKHRQAAVELETFGFIDKTGKFVIPPVFDQVEEFSEGLAAVKFKGKWGFINRQGQFVVKPTYPRAFEFHDGLAGVAVLGEEGANRREAIDGAGCKLAFINRAGKIVIEPKFYIPIRGGRFSEGLAAVVVRSETHSDNDPFEYRYGYINRQGQLVIPARFYKAGDFSEGLAIVAVLNPGIERSPELRLYARREGRLWGIRDIRY